MSTEILIIDDNPDIRNILKDLISDAGYETRIAANYNQALKEIKNTSVKIAVDSVKKILSTSVDQSKLDNLFDKNLEESKELLKKINS